MFGCNLTIDALPHSETGLAIASACLWQGEIA